MLLTCNASRHSAALQATTFLHSVSVAFFTCDLISLGKAAVVSSVRMPHPDLQVHHPQHRP